MKAKHKAADATRAAAVKWCLDNGCNFRDPVYPPPTGWAWAKSGEALVLVPIFTMTHQGEEITSVEVANAAHAAQKGGE